ncbi:NAD-dependent epimerase/dehydratase family protein [Lewinella sp. 4G2]|uniref:NAD-dependent epimerase/dehydratase family protein n=1 Tax=Lewinella sp. 4G2 TaxID=1803372 RepID=UPI0007E0C85D|nr:NAD-dependent epimerase/dehydratase family protein [Lewinella sp. 4G2]OAV42792.1 hypothetical protein A3850_016280 [Lewinella sp. 4G2]
MPLNVVLTGASGMIGKGVLLECLENKAVDQVLSIARRPGDITHPKLRELIHEDFTDFSTAIDQLTAFQPGACFHCMGVSSAGMNEADYTRLTYTVTQSLADAIYAANYRSVFIYVSGAGTDGTESGRLMWARVKGKTENYILNRGFAAAYAFRIGMVIPGEGIKSKSKWVNALLTVTKPLYGLFNKFKSVSTSAQVGKAMINAARTQVQGSVLSAKEIKTLGGG